MMWKPILAPGGSLSLSGFRMRAGNHGKDSGFPLQHEPELSKKRKQQLG